jgi:molybdopterin converting factor small subunit
MIVPVSLFAKARDLAGAPLVHLELPPGATVAHLRRELITACPPLAPLAPSLLISLNDEYAVDSRVVPPGTSVSCFPPVSGG